MTAHPTTTVDVALIAGDDMRGNYEFTLTVTDKASGTPIVEASLDLAQFATLVGTSFSHVTVDAHLYARNVDRWGLRHEHRSMVVPWLGRDDWPRWNGQGNSPVLPDETLERVAVWAAEVCPDADPPWRPRNESYNGHRAAPGGGHSVSFDRWVADEA